MAELTKRVLTALIGIPLFLLALVGPPPTVLPEGSTWTALVMLIALLGTVEMLSAVERKYPEVRVNRVIALLSVYLPLDAWLNAQELVPFLPTVRLTALGAILLALGWEVWQAERRGNLSVWRNVGFGALIALYLGVLLSGWVGLRLRDVGCDDGAGGLSEGLRLVILTCVSVWLCDTGAYFVGKRFGRRRMAPLLSPRKSWEGAIAGVLFGTAGAVLASGWLEVSPLSAGVMGVLATCMGQVGDLFESALKRELEIKDFGGLLPGHGGVMDRLDSLLFALPVIYVVSHFLPICP
ncbi:MAG: phosphatidate cytidylyltransferase [Chthonomonadetes bacterium]|nr:phosphatidate cytidylyltransferase [Chthonomonadetes bacterium]